MAMAKQPGLNGCACPAASGLHLLSHLDDIVRLSSLAQLESLRTRDQYQVSLREAVHDRPIGNTWHREDQKAIMLSLHRTPARTQAGTNGIERLMISVNSRIMEVGMNTRLYKTIQGCKDVQMESADFQSELHPSCRQEPNGFASFSSELGQLESTHCRFGCNG